MLTVKIKQRNLLARKSRVFVEDVAQYIALVCDEQSGMFRQQEDYEYFVSLLEDLHKEFDLSIHAYTLLPQSFEALITPCTSEALAKFMQLLARRYVVYFNKKYKRQGTLWKRRYVSILVDDEYLYEIIKYIETKSLNFVENEKRYRYSSIRINLAEESSNIIEYRKGFSSQKYKQNYSSLLTQKEWDYIDKNIEKQHVIGSSRFINRLEELTGLSLQINSRGRPKKTNLEKRNTMYKNLVVLDKEKHKNLKVSPFQNLLFAKDTTTLSLTYKEVGVIAKSYPVVFSNNEDNSFAVLVSLGQMNLAIDTQGRWIGEYIPMTIRKYPFSVIQNGEDKDKNIVLIDEDASLFSKSKGKQLFKKSGEISEILKKSIEFVSQYDIEMKKTRKLTKEIQKSGILEMREVRVNNGEESKVLIQGFSVVNTEKLQKLDKKILEKWEKNGTLAIIKAHLASLKNIQNLFNLAKNRQV